VLCRARYDLIIKVSDYRNSPKAGFHAYSDREAPTVYIIRCIGNWIDASNIRN
jgi:hypothetical protein